MDLMERLVCDLKWLGRLSWMVGILLLAAVKIFGAPLATFFIGAWVWIIGAAELRGWFRERQRHR